MAREIIKFLKLISYILNVILKIGSTCKIITVDVVNFSNYITFGENNLYELWSNKETLSFNHRQHMQIL